MFGCEGRGERYLGLFRVGILFDKSYRECYKRIEDVYKGVILIINYIDFILSRERG